MLLYGIALLGLPLIAGVACEAPAASPTIDPNNRQIYANANEAFQDLLNALPEESLHAALNSLTGFKAGVFESNRHGVEHVHHDNPPLATKLIVAAVQDLKKRQAPAPSANSTASSAEPSSSNPPTQTSGQSLPPSSPPSSTGPPPSSNPPPESSNPPQSSNPPESSNPPPASSSPPPVVLPVQVTTTDANGKPTVISTSIYSDVTAFIPVDVTRTDAQGSTLVTKESKPAVIFTATDSAGSAFVTASAVNFAPTLGQVLTSTDSAGSTFITTYTPTGGRVSRIVLVTTTDGDGRPSVVTSYTYVDPVGPTGVDRVETTGTTRTGAASLQTNAARANGVRDAAFLGGFVGVFALFV